MAQLITGSGGYAATVGGTVRIAGSNDVDVIYLADLPGRITFDGSFNRGGDFIILPKAAKNYTAVRTGSSITLSDADTMIVIPVGTKGASLQFADGELVLRFNGQIVLGSQVISTTAATITASLAQKTSLPTPSSAAGTLIMSSDEPVLIGGNMRVLGTNGSDTVTVADFAGSIAFDGSFNRGGDKVVLPLNVEATNAKLLGSSAVFSNDALKVTLPVGKAGALVQFNDDTRLLSYDAVAKRATLGSEALVASDAALQKGGAAQSFLGTTGDDLIDSSKINLSSDGRGNIDGGKGNDTIILGRSVGGTASEGDDTYKGIWDFNTLRYWSLTEGVTIDIDKGLVTTASGKTDRFSGIDVFWGTGWADTFIGGWYPAKFNPLNGDDTVIGGPAGDIVGYMQPSTSFTVTYDKSTNTFTVKDNVTFSGTDTLKNIARLEFGDGVTYFGRLSDLTWEDYKREYDYTKSVNYSGLETAVNVAEAWFSSLTIPRSAFQTSVDTMVLDNTLYAITGYGSYYKVSDNKQLVFYSGWYHAAPNSGSLFVIEYENGSITYKKDYRIEGATHSWPVKLSDGSTVVVFTGVDEGKHSIKASALAPVYVYDVDDRSLITTNIRTASHNNQPFDFNGDGLIDIVSQNFAGYGDPDNDGRPFVLINNGDGTFTRQKWATDPAQAVYGDQTQFGAMAIAPLGLQPDGTYAVVMLDSSGYSAFGLEPRATYIFYFTADMKTVVRAEQLPDPFFERAEYASVKQVEEGWRNSSVGISHDVNVRAIDLDGDGRVDLVIQSVLWSGEQGMGAIQVLMNRVSGWVDETSSRIFGLNLMNPGAGHWSNFFDVNGDGFLDLITMDPTTNTLDVNRNGQADYRMRTPGDDYDIDMAINLSPGTKVLLNDGTGHFVVVIDYQIPWNQIDIMPTFVTSLDELGRLRFTGIQSDPTFQSDKTAVITTRTVDFALSTGPNGSNPADKGAPGFNEFYYLLNNKDVQTGIENGTIKSGLEHYLAIGRAEGRAAFAPNAWVQGSAQNDVITLREGKELGYGGDGDDFIDGKAGDDRLYGGAGNDILTGGSGKDLFVFDTALSKAGVDRITDFNPAEDKLELATSIFKGFSGSVQASQLLAEAGASQAKTAEQRLIYDTQSGKLFYDEDGSGTGFGPVQIAVLDGAPALSSNSFVFG